VIGSPSFAPAVSKRHGVDPARWTIVSGATDTERFVPHRAPGALGAPPTLLYHGRVDARKGVLDLLDAVADLLDRGRRLRLVVSGIGPDTTTVADRVTELGIDDHVTQLGYTAYEDAHEVYRRGDVFVSPTYAEGFSNTVLEAMASGLPVVSTDVVGVRDCVRDGDNGLLVPPKDPAALADGIARVLDDTDLRVGIARRALDEVRARWSWPVIAHRLTDVYAAVRDVPVPAIDDVPVDPDCRFRAAPHLL
jgi:glycosyltransferase involved in cell wall biosynthesis